MTQQDEQKPVESEEGEVLEIQESEQRSIGKQERLKKVIRRHPQRDAPRVDSVEIDERRGESIQTGSQRRTDMARQASKHPRSIATQPPVAAAPDMPFAEGARDELSPDMRHRMISEAAYFLHTQRGYKDGYDLDDWLQAEAEIDHVLVNLETSEGQSSEAQAPE